MTRGSFYFLRTYLRAFWCGVILLNMLVFAVLWIGQATPRALLAFTSKLSGNNQVYLVDSWTNYMRQVTQNPGGGSHPAWSADVRLAFAAYPAPLHLATLDLTSWQTNVVAYDDFHSVYEPAWSADGRLAAASNQNLNWDIVIYDPQQENSTLARFNTEFNELEPCWWSNGRLSFVSNREGSDDIYLYDFEADTLINLTNDPASDYNPACSTDGRLAFTSTRDYNAEIYVMDLKTGLTQPAIVSRADEFNPAWLPDGRLSFVSNRGGNREIYILDLDTGSLMNVTQSPSDEDQPAWSN